MAMPPFFLLGSFTPPLFFNDFIVTPHYVFPAKHHSATTAPHAVSIAVVLLAGWGAAALMH